MNKAKTISKTFFEIFINMLAGVFLPLGIWVGAILALLDHEEFFLAVILFLSGLAYVYRDWKEHFK